MAKSNKPIVWGLFAAGGTVSAFVIPVLVLLTLLAAVGHTPQILQYENLKSFAALWWGKAAIFGVIFFSLWGAAHRLRITCYDFGLRADTIAAIIVYAAAALGSVATLVYLAAL